MGWAGVPSVGGPGLADEAADDDHGVGQCDERLDHTDSFLGADGELAEAAVVPGVGSFHDPSGAGLEWEAFLADDPLAAQFGQEFTGGV